MGNREKQIFLTIHLCISKTYFNGLDVFGGGRLK